MSNTSEQPSNNQQRVADLVHEGIQGTATSINEGRDQHGINQHRESPSLYTGGAQTHAKRKRNHHDNDDEQTNDIALSETRLVHALRLLVGIVLVSATVLAATAVYRLTKHDEKLRFQSHVKVQSGLIANNLNHAVSERLGVLSSMATTITSLAMATDQEFPFVTIPDFALRGCDTRVQSRAHVLHYMPVVYDENREAWEGYALKHRGHIEEDFQDDWEHRRRQDQELGFPVNDNENIDWRPQQYQNATLLQDGSNYHPRIWSSGETFPEGDIPVGNGPYLPFWHRSPINVAKQERLNADTSRNYRFTGVLPALLENKKAIMQKASVHGCKTTPLVAQNFNFSQFRHEDFAAYKSDPYSFVAYPVMDSFRPDANVAAVVSSAMYWRLLFASSLADETTGSFVCVIENSFNQTLTYLAKGPTATFVGEKDSHDTNYEAMVHATDIMETFATLQSPATRSYTSVGLNTKYSRYSLKIYPTAETEALFSTGKPKLYAYIVVAIFGFTALLFLALMYFVERRQRILMARVVANSEKGARAERDLNEFLAHEVRNPLSSAIVAHNFIMARIESNPHVISDENTRRSIQSDGKIITSSLSFIDDFLRSMLLMYRAFANKLEISLAPTNVLKGLLEPVTDILRPRSGSGIEIVVECPDGLAVMTDRLRMEQVLLNLGRNASKFVTKGFICFKGYINTEGMVEISVEDSGNGVPPEIRPCLFQKYHTSLDVVTRGNGIGLALCKNLVSRLSGDIWLDESYHSSVPGHPGARFVVTLNKPPLFPVNASTTSNTENNSSEKSLGNKQTNAPDKEISIGLPKNLSVLFVDDDAILRKLFMRSISKVCPDWNVQGVCSGEAALDLVLGKGSSGDIEDQCEGSKNRFHLIFIDQYMANAKPQLLGTETVEALRARGVDCTLIGLSANDLEHDFVEAGADYFVLKPLPCEPKALTKELVRLTGQICGNN